MATGPAHIALIGFMGSGKSSVGGRLAEILGTSFTDADAAIETAEQRTITEIFETNGEAAFRTLEHDTIERLLRGLDPGGGVLALGGGAAMHPGTRAALKAGAITVHLRVSLRRALDRVGGDTGRPMLRRADLADLHARRTEVYDAIADVSVDTDERTVDQVVAAVADGVLAATARSASRKR